MILSVAGGLLKLGLRNAQFAGESISYVLKTGFGAANGESTLRLAQSSERRDHGFLLLNILVGSSPQLLISLLFLTYNGLFTSLLLMNEWFDFALERRYLRVTDPVGKQRSTYHLQIPYRYSLSLLELYRLLQ